MKKLRYNKAESKKSVNYIKKACMSHLKVPG